MEGGEVFGRRVIGGEEVVEVWLEFFLWDVGVVEVGASPSETGDIEIVAFLPAEGREFEIAIKSGTM